MRILITLDTEADGQWSHGRPVATENVAWWPPFQQLCARHEAFPTYLITSEIATDERARAFLAPLVAAGTAEVGTHLHPWTTPPFADEPGLRQNDERHAYPCQLDRGLLAEKLVTLTDQIEAAVGKRPTSFRAGRFGMDVRVAQLLAGLGYVVDSSVTPYVNWRANPGRPGWGGGPDFSRHRPYPFRVEGGGGLVEIPVTIMPTNPLTRVSAFARRHWQARPLRLARRAVGLHTRPQPVWLRPRPEYVLGDLVALLRQAAQRHVPFAVLMFHSSELLPGASPYRPDEAAVDELLELLDGLFASARAAGHTFTTLSAAGRELAAFDGLPTEVI